MSLLQLQMKANKQEFTDSARYRQAISRDCHRDNDSKELWHPKRRVEENKELIKQIKILFCKLYN